MHRADVNIMRSFDGSAKKSAAKGAWGRTSLTSSWIYQRGTLMLTRRMFARQFI